MKILNTPLTILVVAMSTGPAICSEIVVFKDYNFDGKNAVFYQSEKNLENVWGGGQSNWSDEISSIKVKSGRWRIHDHVNFGGRSYDLGPGEYPNPESFGMLDNTISSIEKLE